jgi:hypothetical protein
VNLPKWPAAAVEVRDSKRSISGNPVVDDEFKLVHRFLGRRLEEHVDATSVEPNRHLRHWGTWRSNAALEVNRTFEEFLRVRG